MANCEHLKKQSKSQYPNVNSMKRTCYKKIIIIEPLLYPNILIGPLDPDKYWCLISVVILRHRFVPVSLDSFQALLSTRLIALVMSCSLTVIQSNAWTSVSAFVQKGCSLGKKK